MKRILLILAVEVGTAGCLLGQMSGMDPHPQPGNTKAAPATVQRPLNPNVTFTKDVAPIVQEHCQTCHRPGEGTPFSLMTYESAKPWAKDIKNMVETKAMPPWFEDGTTESSRITGG